jgi:SAM-dependent methyltransferase
LPDDSVTSEELGSDGPLTVRAERPAPTWHNGPLPKDYFAPLAADYERRWPELHAPHVVDPIVDFLAGVAGSGPALELAIGTGRIARPLIRRGLSVHGIDLSAPMLAELMRSPDGAEIPVVVGDMTTTRLDERFSLVYVVANSISNLTTQDAQVECFLNAAAHLVPGGRFVVELWVPELQRLPPGETVCAFEVTAEHLGFDDIDVASQTLTSNHYWVRDGQFEFFTAPFRYAWPAELDLMARIAGMTLRERWGGWQREPFTSESRKHVSVWETTS